ncbi:MAG: hypothetical protein FJY29_12240 [Betaproteobacteria bacterium]|nr:hypothetical protein [Betaproteobacteria bacterium]
MRTIHEDHTVIRWTGGTRVVWDWLRPPLEHRSTELPNFLSCPAALASGQSTRTAPVKSSAATLGFTEWMRETTIFAAERCKFFTNFMLAAAVGPQLAKNKTLSERLEDSIVSHQAQQFAVLWEHHGVTAEQLKLTLMSTVADTGENINSLSYAAVQGKTGTMAWFLQSLEEDIRRSPRRAKLEPLISFLSSVRKNWRME